MATRLPTQAFLAIAAVAWADGRMRKNEALGLERAATEYGLDGPDLEAVRHATTTSLSIDDVDLGDMSRWERALTYAFANWLAKLDGVTGSEELKTLRALGERLDLPQASLQSAASAAFDIACLPEGHRPEKYDFAALEARLREKLPGSFRDSLPPV